MLESPAMCAGKGISRMRRSWLFVVTLALFAMPIWGQSQPALSETSTLVWPAPESQQKSKVEAAHQGDQLVLSNEAISGAWSIQNGSLHWMGVTNKFTGTALPIDGSAFELIPREGSPLRSEGLKIIAGPFIEDIIPPAASTKAADRVPGKQIRIELEDASANVRVVWR